MQFKNAVIGNKQYGQLSQKKEQSTKKDEIKSESNCKSIFIFKDNQLNSLLVGQSKENTRLNIILKSDDSKDKN